MAFDLFKFHSYNFISPIFFSPSDTTNAIIPYNIKCIGAGSITFDGANAIINIGEPYIS